MAQSALPIGAGRVFEVQDVIVNNLEPLGRAIPEGDWRAAAE